MSGVGSTAFFRNQSSSFGFLVQVLDFLFLVSEFWGSGFGSLGSVGSNFGIWISVFRF